jgi:RHS repeat-associated protein
MNKFFCRPILLFFSSFIQKYGRKKSANGHPRYGNSLPIRTVGSVSDPKVKWMFELVFDFGEHDIYDPQAAESPGLTWECREDPISSFQSGFEVRTYRLCKRVLMFHHFDELDKNDYLTKALELRYDKGPAITYLSSASLAGFVLRKSDDPSQDIPGPYFVQRLPPLKLEYAKTPTEDQLQRLAVQEFSPDNESMNNVPIGLQGSTQWVDLLGEGINGLLTTSGGAWYYKRNLSAANFIASNDASGTIDDAMVNIKVAKFGPLESVTSGPGSSTDTQPKFMDLTGDGRVSFVLQQRPVAGFYRHTTEVPCTAPFCNDLFEPFRPFESWLTQTTDDPNLRFIDLTGDGKADILISQDDVLTWYESLGECGFAPARSEYLAATEELSPRVLFSDTQETIQLADFNGDGLPDIVRIRNGEICFWPNMGYGRFGAKVVMDNAPVFDSDDAFTSQHLLMGDIDGSGTTDLIYFHRTGARLYFNLAGNAWAPEIQLDSLLPYYDSLTTMTVVDLLGSGTMCLVWSSSHPEDMGRRSMRYVDLTGGQKPHLLTKLDNSLGKVTRLLYLPSTTYYLQDLEAGNPWATRLQYPQHCLDRIITDDKVSRVTLSQRYRYRHGYYDGVEREFRGFGMVEQWDTEEFDGLSSLPAGVNVDTATYAPPIHTKTWFHTGAFTDHELLSRAYAREYYGAPNPSTAGAFAFDDFFARQLRDQIEADQSDRSGEELRQASRALKGSLLRSEVYVDDESPVFRVPYQIQDVGNSVRMLQPRGQNPYAVFQVYAREQMIHDMERDPSDPKTKHSIKLEVDEYGNEVQSLAIWYGREGDEVVAEFTDEDRKKQKEIKISYTNNQYTNPVLEPDDYRIPMICEKSRYELPGSIPVDKVLARYTIAEFANLGGYQEVPFESSPTGNQKRLLERVETIYRKNNFKGNSKFRELESLALPGTQHTLCLTKSMVSSISQKISSDPNAAVPFMEKGGYVNQKDDGSWWIPASQIFYSEDTASDELSEAKASFFSPRRMLDEFHVTTVLRWDSHFVSCLEIEDQVVHNLTKGVLDYRTLQLKQVIDINSNIKEVAFDALGMVVGLVVRGKDGEAVGDTLEGFRANMTKDEIHKFLQNPDSLARTLLAGASTRFIYDVNFSSTDGQDFPASVSTITRTQHHHDQVAPSDAIMELSVAYFDGYHRLIQKKEKAEPLASTPKEPRWRGSSWSIFNNKGLPVQTFEPFFDSTHVYQFDRQEGVSSFHVYDGLAREVAVILPNKTWTKTVEGSWHAAAWDANDTAQGQLNKDSDVGYLVQKLPLDLFGPSWYDQRKDGQLGDQEQTAATKTLAHVNTPTTTYVDVTGRPILVVQNNASYGKIATRTEYDIDGNVLEVKDGQDKVVASSQFSMTGRVLNNKSTDSGERWHLTTTRGEPLLSWDARGNRLRTEYDPFRRRTELYWQKNGKEILIHKNVYGEGQADDKAHNLRGKLFQEHDQAGVVTRQEWDFKGNELLAERQFASNYKTDLNWTDKNTLEPDIYPTHSLYDAKNRTIAVTSPDESVLQKSFNQGGFLHSITGILKGDSHQTTFLASCEYDAYGRQSAAVAGNSTITTYTYGKLTQRLTNKTVLRQQSGKDSTVQNLTYTYDPVGNIMYIQNKAEQTIFFRNGAVYPDSEYTYDAIYRIIEATGREHVGQTKGSPSGPGTTSSASSAAPAVAAEDGSAMVKYKEKYEYDSAGNITSLYHHLFDAKFPDWTRNFSYEAEKGVVVSNRLVSTSVGNRTENYRYDENGNIKSMPYLSDMAWDCKNQLRRSSKQVVANGIPETTWYLYDGNGQRVRKVTERQSDLDSPGAPTMLKDHLIISGFEIFRKYGGDGTKLVKQCETLKVRRDRNICALVENWSDKENSNNSSFRLIRFQLRDHVGSINLELDEDGNLVSYEEFSPYGSTTYQSLMEKAPKRFRYAGKERDNESGLYYFGLRYYATWLTRWISPDPIGIGDGLNVFEYVGANPIRNTDPLGTSRQSASMQIEEPMSQSDEEEHAFFLSRDTSNVAENLATDYSNRSETHRRAAIDAPDHPFAPDSLTISAMASSASAMVFAAASLSEVAGMVHIQAASAFLDNDSSGTGPGLSKLADSLDVLADKYIDKGSKADTRSKSLGAERYLKTTVASAQKILQKAREAISRAPSSLDTTRAESLLRKAGAEVQRAEWAVAKLTATTSSTSPAASSSSSDPLFTASSTMSSTATSASSPVHSSTGGPQEGSLGSSGFGAGVEHAGAGASASSGTGAGAGTDACAPDSPSDESLYFM